MTIEVRILEKGDESVLGNIASDVFDDPIDPRASAEFLRDPRLRLAVAIDSGLVIGFASAGGPFTTGGSSSSLPPLSWVYRF